MSNLKSSGCRTFYHSNRMNDKISRNGVNNPGPGMYRLPSDFGYYEDYAGGNKKRPNFGIKRRANSLVMNPEKL